MKVRAIVYSSRKGETQRSGIEYQDRHYYIVRVYDPDFKRFFGSFFSWEGKKQWHLETGGPLHNGAPKYHSVPILKRLRELKELIFEEALEKL